MFHPFLGASTQPSFLVLNICTVKINFTARSETRGGINFRNKKYLAPSR
jgi:hypothetical protein